jgi:hypothetical protein
VYRKEGEEKKRKGRKDERIKIKRRKCGRVGRRKEGGST